MLSIPFPLKVSEGQATIPSSPSGNSRRSHENTRPSLETQPNSSNAHSLSQAVHARRAEYTRPQKVRIKVGTWNVAACPGTELDLKGWFGEGKGIDRRLAGLAINGSHEEVIESKDSQEARRHKKQSTIPIGEQSALPHGKEIGLYVLGLQEVVALSSAKQYMGNVYTDTATITKWREALQHALPKGYSLVSEQQLSGMMLFIMASPQIAPTISSVSSTSVGTGMLGYLGNKGAVVTRIVLGETTRLVFVNSHLASGSDSAHLDRRCWDAAQIQQRVSFDPISWAGVLDDKHEAIGDEDFAFWFGDLNFRIHGLPGEDIRRILMLHSRGEYDLEKQAKVKAGNSIIDRKTNDQIYSIESDDDSDEADSRVSKTFTAGNHGDESSLDLPDPDEFAQDPSQDPASLQATIDSLLPHDQLRSVQKQRKAFHDGWQEGQIRFLPTYKYDVGSIGLFDTSEKKRAPSWCDRILYRTRRNKLEYDGKTQEEEIARIKDAEMKARGLEQAGEEEDVLFDYNPDEDGTEQQQTSNDYDEYDEDEPFKHAEEVVTKEGYLDRISLDVYTSHQRVLSSDHKPLEAVFTLDYDAVVPELKSKVQQEVARELDKTENETRPGITIVIDHSQDSDDEESPHDASSNHPVRPRTGDSESVEYGKVAYLQRKTRNITIANTGQVPATFSFVGRPGLDGRDERIAPSWLCVRFLPDSSEALDFELVNPKSQMTLEPGETLNAVLDLFVDNLELVRALNDGATKLEDILVVRVAEGRDHFVPVHGTWLKSCFGRSIEELIHVPEGGVRAARKLIPQNTSNASESDAHEVTWSAPRELIKLTDAIEQLAVRVVADANMIESAQVPGEAFGWPFDSHTWLLDNQSARENKRRCILDALDTDKDLNNNFPPEMPAIERLEIVAEVLLAFLLSIADGIVTTELWAKIEHDYVTHTPRPLSNAEDIKTWILDVLCTSPNHNISFVFITSMLCRVANELAPVPKHNWRHSAIGSARSSLSSVRRSLSIRNRGKKENSEAGPSDDPIIVKREAVEKAFAALFVNVLFRGGEERMGRDRKVLDERRREILESFLKVGRET